MADRQVVLANQALAGSIFKWRRSPKIGFGDVASPSGSTDAAGTSHVRVHPGQGPGPGARNSTRTSSGFQPKEEITGGVVYEFAGGTACFLYPTPNAGTSKASQAFWQVEDVDGEIEALKARGVVFEDYDMPGERARAAPSRPAVRRRRGSRTAKATSWR